MNNVIKTKVSIFRNVKDYKFSSKLDEKQQSEIIEKVKNALKDDMLYINLDKADASIIKFLKSNDLVLGQTQNLFVKKDRIVINMFNGEHLTIVASCDNFDKSIFEKAQTLANKLAQSISFSYSDELGYLMSDITKIGAGIKIESDIMLSAITTINKIEQVRSNVGKLGFSLKSTRFPSVYTLSTQCNLGMGETQIMEDFESTLNRLQELEIESAKMLDVTDHDSMLDKVNRSIAILNSAHLMNYDELYNHMVNLRMGINVDIVDIEPEKLNKLNKIILEKSNDLISQSELIEIASRVKHILKGE